MAGAGRALAWSGGPKSIAGGIILDGISRHLRVRCARDVPFGSFFAKKEPDKFNAIALAGKAAKYTDAYRLLILL